MLSTILTALLLALLALTPAAQARTSRAYEGSFGSGSLGAGVKSSPAALAVDQGNGDVYAVGPNDGSPIRDIVRFDSSGTPKNFTEGSGAGTNTLTGRWSATASIAIDNSGGPLDGTVYVLRGGVGETNSAVEAFTRTGAALGEIDGTGTGRAFGSQDKVACSIAVDQSDGSLYIGQLNRYTWRYVPNSPAGGLDDADYAVSGIAGSSCGGLAADSGDVYASISSSEPLWRYSAADFAFPATPAGALTGAEVLAGGVTAVAVDPGNGDLYANRAGYVSVFDSAGQPLYEFGARAYSGDDSQGIAVRADGPGPAAKAYVADRSSEHEVDVFGALTKVPTYTRPAHGSFGPDGSDASGFSGLIRLALDHTAQRLYALDNSVPGIYGFDASAPPPPFTPLGAFSPLGTADAGTVPGLAVDNTALASAGNVYLVSGGSNFVGPTGTQLIYGWDEAGAPLAGFPIEPATSPGAPEGSPKSICGVAVDSAGNVWVANQATEKVLRYSSAGAYLGAVDTSAQGGGPCALALDSADNLYANVVAGSEPQWSGVVKYTAASGYAAATHVAGGAGGDNIQSDISLAVDSSDDHIYVVHRFGHFVNEFDPAGNLVDEFAVGTTSRDVAVDPASANTYLAVGNQIRAVGPGILLPEVTAKPASALANSSATLNGEVVTQGVALTECRFEYVSLAAFRDTGFTDLSSGGSEPCDPAFGSIPLDLDEHPVSAPATGLATDTAYRFRLIATNADGETQTEVAAFQTVGPPRVETTGTPIRTTTTARLLGRVNPVRAATDYHFEYGNEGPCEANPCASTPTRSAPAGDQVRLVAENVGGLEANTTYHYRLIADNGNPDGPQAGEDTTVTTRSSDQLPDQNDPAEFPGPPDSDRAWELVSLPDTSGNPVSFVRGFSTDGNRALYATAGGTPDSPIGALDSLHFAERVQSAPHQGGWQPRQILPPRSELAGASLGTPLGRNDLSSFALVNLSANVSRQIAWRLAPDGAPEKLFEVNPPLAVSDTQGGYIGVSADGSRVIERIEGGTVDPDHPGAGNAPNLYDVSVSPPALVSLLPGEALSPCGADAGILARADWVSEEGSRAFFQSAGPACAATTHLYMRDLDAEETKLISGPPLSGPDCGGNMVKALAGAVFFTTDSRLVAEDAEPPGFCGEATDVYRYDLGDESLDCLTCLAPGLETDVGSQQLATDGSRLYFGSASHLLPGSPPHGQSGAYRLDLGSGELAYVGGLSSNNFVLSSDGSYAYFSADRSSFNPLGEGTDNGGTTQAYLYSDAERWTVCVSCPANGSPASGNAGGKTGGELNTSTLSDQGIVAFHTPVALVAADQNTAGAGAVPAEGQDVYEWRDGRQVLVTDGTTSWPAQADGVNGAPLAHAVSPSGENVFFTAWAALTNDALDGFNRLYSARIGGGFAFPPPGLPDCDLNAGACEGPGTDAPESPGAGSAVFEGPPDDGEPYPLDCSVTAKAAQRQARAARRQRARALRLRRAAKRSANPRRARALNRRAARYARASRRRAAAAKRLRARARRCRANADRRANR